MWNRRGIPEHVCPHELEKWRIGPRRWLTFCKVRCVCAVAFDVAVIIAHPLRERPSKTAQKHVWNEDNTVSPRHFYCVAEACPAGYLRGYMPVRVVPVDLIDRRWYRALRYCWCRAVVRPTNSGRGSYCSDGRSVLLTYAGAHDASCGRKARHQNGRGTTRNTGRDQKVTVASSYGRRFATPTIDVGAPLLSRSQTKFAFCIAAQNLSIVALAKLTPPSHQANLL